MTNTNIKIHITLLVGLLLSVSCFANNQLQGFPSDTSVVIGKLDNGLTYYVRENQKPENTAELRLIIKAGSILENPSQKGLAHFCEHMAFNGSKNFSGNEIISTLEGLGVKFGTDLNAATGFDKTIYQIEIPLNNKKNLETGLLILSDWADRLSFDQTEIDKERGVIMSEWRSSKGATNRLRDKLIPKLFYNSRYAERLPIGDTLIIQNFVRDTIVSFYNNWYRPNLMGVVAVGDFNKNEVIELIKNYFSNIQNPENAPVRTQYSVLHSDTTFFVPHIDPEITQASLSVMTVENGEKGFSEEQYRQSIIEDLFETIFNDRLTDIVQGENPPFKSASIGISDLNFNVRLRSVSIVPLENNYLEALKVVEKEFERIQQHGILKSELERAIRELKYNHERSVKNIDERKSAVFTNQYITNFLLERPTISDSVKFEMFKEICASLTPNDVKTEIVKWQTKHNRVILIEAPAESKQYIPKYTELINVIDHSSFTELKEPEDDLSGKTFFDKELGKSKVVNKNYIKKYGITEMTLDNGVRVVYKPTDYSKDYIQFRALSPGGNSVLPDSLYLASVIAQTVIHQSGIGNYTRSDLNKYLQGKRAKVIPGINTYNEGMVGSCDHDNLELMMQMIYQYFTSPRIDTLAFERTKRNYISRYENAGNNPNSFFSDTCNSILYGNHPRKIVIPNIDDIKKINIDELYSLYEDRYADASDFTFIFVGDINVDSISPVITNYLGALPATNRNEEPRNINVEVKASPDVYEIYKGIDQEISTVIMYYRGEFSKKTKYEVAYEAAESLIEMELLKKLREEMGQIYSVSVKTSSAQVPEPEYLGKIAFRCAPQNAENLVDIVKQVVDEISAKSIDPENIEKIKKQMLASAAIKEKSNLYWVQLLKEHYEAEIKLKQLTNRERIIAQLDQKKLANAVQQYFSSNSAVSFILYPEGYVK